MLTEEAVTHSRSMTRAMPPARLRESKAITTAQSVLMTASGAENLALQGGHHQSSRQHRREDSPLPNLQFLHGLGVRLMDADLFIVSSAHPPRNSGIAFDTESQASELHERMPMHLRKSS